MAKRLIKIAPATLDAMKALAEPFLGVADCGPLMKALGSLLAAAHPQHKIECLHVTHAPDLAAPLIRVVVVVDGTWDQGLFFTRPDPVPAVATVEG